jgi:hypothetical protein
LTNQKQKLPVVAMLVNGLERKSNIYIEDLQTWPPQEILVSDRVSSKKPSPLKPLGQMNRNLVGSIFGRFSIRIAHFVPIINKHGRHRQLLSLIGFGIAVSEKKIFRN